MSPERVDGGRSHVALDGHRGLGGLHQRLVHRAEWTGVSLADLLLPEQLAAAASIEVEHDWLPADSQPMRPALCTWQPAIRVNRCNLHMVRRCD